MQGVYKRKPYLIPRTDTRPRCGKCKRILKRDEDTWQDSRYFGYRFPRVGVCCRVIHRVN